MLTEALYSRLFPRWIPKDELRPRSRSAKGAVVLVRWLGTAAHVVETETTRVLLDPFLTRPSLGSVARKPLESDPRLVFERIRTRVDAVLCGHSHFDHLLDAPLIARELGAKLVGSRTTCAYGRAAGVPEDHLIEVPASGARVRIGDMDVRFVPSKHGRIFLGKVPFPGEVAHASVPARAYEYKMGGAFGVLLRAGGTTVYHNGSADLVDAELQGEHADVLLVGLAGRKATPDYLARLVGMLGPKLIVPTHHDAFFAPLDRGVHLLPGIDLDGFVTEARRLAPRATVITPDYEETIAVAPDARDSALLD